MTFLRNELDDVLGLTNAHVADGMAGCLDEVGKRAQVGGAYLSPNWLIAKHPTLDLATFHLSDIVLGQVGFLADYSISPNAHHVAATVPVWPPCPPLEGQPVMYCGYPASYRRDLDGGNVEFTFAWFAGKLRSSSDHHVGLVLDLETSGSFSPTRIPPNADLGGMSGGPVFRIVDASGIERLELAALVYEYSPAFEIAFAYPLISLQPDGTFID